MLQVKLSAAYRAKDILTWSTMTVSQDEGVQAALDRMHPSWQSDDEIAQLLHDARIKPEAASAQEAAFFAKHGCVMPWSPCLCCTALKA